MNQIQTPKTETIAWLLEADGVRPVVHIRPIFFPGHVEVTFTDGTKAIDSKWNLLSRDNLDIKFFSAANAENR
jgi:hypothetical protein